MMPDSRLNKLLDQINKINERLDAIEKKLNEQENQTKKRNIKEWLDKFGDYYGTTVESSVPDPCKGCSNHPSNGGSGVCFCTVPYFSGIGVPKWE